MDPFSILVIFLIILISTVFTGAFYDAIWIPTKKENYDRIAQLADLHPEMNFYDLGSGNANILFYLSKKYNVNCTGIEISPFWYLYTKIKSLFYKKVKIKYGNFYKYDLSRADIIYVFSLLKAYSNLENKVDKELKRGGKLILSHWPLKDRKPDNISKKENSTPYYLYLK